MSSLRELKNRLSSINTVGQLAGAMRTVSAAKYSRISNIRSGFMSYAQACGQMMEQFGPDLSAALPPGNPDAPDCYVVMAGNRGLCGGYNSEIVAYAAALIRALPEPACVIAVGKRAEAGLKEAGIVPQQSFVFSDTPSFAECGALISFLREGYLKGEIGSVHLVYHHFINMLSREPVTRRVLPMGAEGAGCGVDALLIPDRATVLKAAAVSCFDSAVYAAILEAASGTQAATLVAMRSAYDNAQESIADLETQISRKRQADVTSGVLETASDFTE